MPNAWAAPGLRRRYPALSPPPHPCFRLPRSKKRKTPPCSGVTAGWGVGSWNGKPVGMGKAGEEWRSREMQEALRPRSARHAAPSKGAAGGAHRKGRREALNARSRTSAWHAPGTLPSLLPGASLCQERARARVGTGWRGRRGRSRRAFSLVASRRGSRPPALATALSEEPLPGESGRGGLVEVWSRWRRLCGFRATGPKPSGECNPRTGTKEAGSDCGLFVETQARPRISRGVTSPVVEGALGLETEVSNPHGHWFSFSEELSRG